VTRGLVELQGSPVRMVQTVILMTRRAGPLALLLLVLATGCRHPPLPTAGSGLRLQAPFPCGVKIHILCGYGCAPAHVRTNDPRMSNEYYALDFVREDGRNGFDKPVVSVAAGVVLSAGWATGGGSPYGRMVYIEHAYRDSRGHHYQSLYAHLNSVLVSKGQRVEAGTVLGTLGGSSSGDPRRFGPHLHFAMYQDARPGLGGGHAWRPEPMGGYRDLRTGLTMIACAKPGPEPVAYSPGR